MSAAFRRRGVRRGPLRPRDGLEIARGGGGNREFGRIVVHRSNRLAILVRDWQRAEG